jgi:hypothetical protein
MLLSLQPEMGAAATNGGLSEVRRVLLSRVGYWLYYRVAAERIEVLAFWHVRKHVDPKRR